MLKKNLDKMKSLWVNTAFAAAWQCCPSSSWGQGAPVHLMAATTVFMPPQNVSGLLSPWHTAHMMPRLENQHHNLGYSQHSSEGQTKPPRSPTRTKSRTVSSMQEARAAPEVLWRWVTHFFAGICHVKSNALKTTCSKRWVRSLAQQN